MLKAITKTTRDLLTKNSLIKKEAKARETNSKTGSIETETDRIDQSKMKTDRTNKKSRSSQSKINSKLKSNKKDAHCGYWACIQTSLMRIYM